MGEAMTIQRLLRVGCYKEHLFKDIEKTRLDRKQQDIWFNPARPSGLPRYIIAGRILNTGEVSISIQPNLHEFWGFFLRYLENYVESEETSYTAGSGSSLR